MPGYNTGQNGGQVDSPELLEMPEIMENFTKVTKSLTKRYINKLCLRRISRFKTVRIKFSVGSSFSNNLYDKKGKQGNAGNQHKAF